MAKVTIVARPTPTQIVGQPTQDPDAVYLTLDVVEDEQHDLSSTTTDNPVEEGGDITDHVRPDPDNLTLHAIVSNTPVTPQQQLLSDSVGTSTPTTGAAAPKVKRDPARAPTAFAQLKAFRDNGALLTIPTSLLVYTDMVITRVSVPRNASNSDALEFTATFKKIRIVKNALTKVVRAKDTRAQQRKKKGAATTKTEDPNDDKDPLNQAFDGAKGKDGFTGKVGGALGGLFGGGG